MGGSWLTWSGNWPLAPMTLAVATASWKPLVSLGFTVALLAGQLSHALPAMYSNHWAIYLGSFVALGFIMWTAPPRMRYIAASVNLVAAAVMAFLMLSWRYGNGVGWYPPAYADDRWMLQDFGWQLFALLLVIAGACAAVGLYSLFMRNGGVCSVPGSWPRAA